MSGNNTQCDDEQVCTSDICPTSGICQYEFNQDPCNDNVFCNGKDKCDGQGSCKGTGDPCMGHGCVEDSQTCNDLVWKSVVVGNHHSCALTNLGEPYCWGYNGYGQLGDGKGNDGSSVPLAVDTSTISGSTTFIQLSAGIEHTCGITSDNIAYCWGSNEHNQLGRKTANISNPIPIAVDTTSIPGRKTFSTLSAGEWHTCGIATDGVAYCWGDDGYGKLGNGEENHNAQTPSPVDTSTISGQKTFLHIAAANYHSCGITTEGLMYCWGYDTHGQLGDGGVGQDSQSPVAVDTSTMEGNTTFSGLAVSNHTCGITTDDVLYCWGNNSNGQVGTGADASHYQSPQRVVTTPISGDKTFQTISIGMFHSCGVTSDNMTYCWGGNFDGQLGNQDISHHSSLPVKVDTTTLDDQDSFSEIASGISHSCGVSTTGKAFCWGRDTYNQLGDGGDSNYSISPAIVETSSITGLKTMHSVTAATLHSCGMTTEGSAYCWGDDEYGYLGNNEQDEDSQQPVPVDTSPITGSKTFLQIDADSMHSCGLTSDKQLYCWGVGIYGQLGSDTTVTYIPIPVDTSTMPVDTRDILQFTAGNGHTCAITSDNTGYCWGSDEYGQLGDSGENQNSSLPKAIDISTLPGEKKFSQLSAGGKHTCGIATDGFAYCWGSDDCGQLGNDVQMLDQSTPSSVDTTIFSGDTTFKSISPGKSHTCGIATDGKGYCWGFDIAGGLGDGGISASSTTPVAIDTSTISGAKTFMMISAGNWHSCAITTDGLAYCWGSDGFGRLGDGGGISDSQSPRAVDTSSVEGSGRFAFISAGDTHSCGVTVEGSAYCWGSDNQGVLGNGGDVDISQLPVGVVSTFTPVD